MPFNTREIENNNNVNFNADLTYCLVSLFSIAKFSYIFSKHIF